MRATKPAIFCSIRFKRRSSNNPPAVVAHAGRVAALFICSFFIVGCGGWRGSVRRAGRAHAGRQPGPGLRLSSGCRLRPAPQSEAQLRDRRPAQRRRRPARGRFLPLGFADRDVLPALGFQAYFGANSSKRFLLLALSERATWLMVMPSQFLIRQGFLLLLFLQQPMIVMLSKLFV